MARYALLDGMRGYFLLFMFLNHLTFSGGYLLVKLNHAELGFVQDAQGFVFLSGLLVGIVYGRRMLKLGFAGGARALWSRAAQLYAYTIGCMVLVLLLRQVLPRAPELWEAWLGGLGDGGAAFRAAGAVMLYQPTYLDILPQYILYFLAAPPIVWLCMTGRWLTVTVGSALLWSAVQVGVHLPFAAALEASLRWVDPALSLRIPFNPLAWQILFVGGMVVGAEWARGRLDLARFFDPAETGLLKACVAGLVFFLLFRLAFTFELVAEPVMRRFQVYENRIEFGPVFLVNFVLLAYAMAWLLLAGPRSGHAWVAALARGVATLFSLPALRLVGRHSLQLYAAHVVLIYLVLWLDGQAGPLSELTKTLIALTGVTLLWLMAAWLDRRGERRQRVVAGQDA